jgi:hypothetical protein
VLEVKQSFSKFVGEGLPEVPADSLNPKLSKYEYRYDQLGNWREKRSFEDGKLSQVVVREIDFW